MDLPLQFLLIVTEKDGWILRDAPLAQSQGGNQVGAAVRVGRPLYAYQIISMDGVPYAAVVPDNPAKPVWGRVGEQGSVIFDDNEKFVKQKPEVRAYVKVIPIRRQSQDGLPEAIMDLADAFKDLADSIRTEPRSRNV